MGDQDVRVDLETASGDEPGSEPGGGSAPSGGGAPSEPDTKDPLGKHDVPSDGADGSPDGSGGSPPSGATDENPLADPKDGPPTVADDGGAEGLVGAGGSGGGGSGGLFGGLGDAYDQAEDLAHETYDDVEEEVAETYEDAGTWESGEHRGTLDRAASDLIDDAARATSDVIDDAARDAGDAFRDSGDAVNELYDDSGVGPVVADAREAGAVVVPSVVEDVYDQGEDLAHRTYGDVEAEVVETYEDASKLDHSGEHWGGLAGTPDEAINDALDVIDPNHNLEEFNRNAGDAIDDAARDAGDAFRDSGDAVNELYDNSGVGPVVADAREAGAVVVPSVVEDVYDQGEDLAHRTYGNVEAEVVETYEDMSYFETKGEHWGGMAGTPDHWLDPLVDGAENVAEAPGDWYEKSGVEDFGSGNTGGVAGESSVPDVDDYGRGAGSGALDPLAPNTGLAGGADETAELAGEEEAQRLTAEVDNLAADPGPIEVPDDPIEALDVIEVAGPMEPETASEWDETIEPV